MKSMFFEDFRVGDQFTTAGITLTEAQIIDFALMYDPQPFHVDTVAASKGPYGGLIASGFQTLAITFRLLRDTGIIHDSSLGGSGGDQLRWLRPVRPGDTLRVMVEVAETSPSRSKDDRGRVRLQYNTYNQRDEPVLSVLLDHIIARRSPETLSV
ncbi:acyl dehydratase [Skermanella stibiiresistens SB22]|uniref:Acyl dehydratase n=1 Tax=Skermanella stibiiresistens SB22 TaxID=1385369 RepID=W9H595_9PROT|nr:MaoC family dehydratase [Skermanella stibiiresistens]EWY38933.1 acyl dehydratase [Skermanella stibiiresistens SB22]